MKQNIQNMEPVLDRLLRLRPSRYEIMDDSPGHEQYIGLIAQETKPLFPEVVDVLPTKPDSLHPNQLVEQHGINYSILSVIAIKAIQELYQQIEAMKKEIDLLKEQTKGCAIKQQ